jgi:pimeloyl-ACP methyl ester carboxylesterase
MPSTSGSAEAAGASGIVVVAHGGQSASRIPTSPIQLSVLRMIPVADAIRTAVRGSGAEVRRVRFRLSGWNGAEASPVRDLTGLLDEIGAGQGRPPVVLVGHSMGGRAAVRAAGHPLVTAVAGLASWLPPGEPADQLAGRRVLLVHASDDSVCRAADTWAYAERASAVAEVAAIEVRQGDHGMLRRAELWHAIAAEFARISLRQPGRPGPVADAFARAAAGRPRAVL